MRARGGHMNVVCIQSWSAMAWSPTKAVGCYQGPCKGWPPTGAVAHKRVACCECGACRKAACGQKHLPQGMRLAGAADNRGQRLQGWPPEDCGTCRKGSRPWTRRSLAEGRWPLDKGKWG
ncbi:hypothetical protein GW17_00060356 [Ensete ventricosum]|nr:hypothetical protein GW17_00060356 [Ensete ventricosum]RZS20160.1 hypothetical protein BHM03_00052641 [Ensete ventricosum]